MVKDFPLLLDRFQRYADALSQATDPPNFQRDELAREVVRRLEQLAFISSQIATLSAEFGKKVIVEVENESGEKELYNAGFERDRQCEFLMRMLAEAFYYFAFRIRRIVRGNEFPFPGFKSFESVGARDVRNHLIEHPEGGASRVLNQTWSWTPDSGPALKTARHEWESSDFVDKGFAANSTEYCIAFGECLDRGLAELNTTGA